MKRWTAPEQVFFMRPHGHGVMALSFMTFKYELPPYAWSHGHLHFTKLATKIIIALPTSSKDKEKAFECHIDLLDLTCLCRYLGNFAHLYYVGTTFLPILSVTMVIFTDKKNQHPSLLVLYTCSEGVSSA
jgi:hypothetical protein